MISDLITLDEETFAAPESRVETIAGVRSRITELRKGDQERGGRRAQVQGLIDGNAPWDQGALNSVGRGDDANINFREAEGLVAAATTPYYELDFGVPRAVNIELRYGDNKQKWFEWSETISDFYSETLWGWKGYKINKQLSHYQMVVHGRGPIIWEGKRGWHFKAKTDDSVWVADNAMCDLDLLEEMALPGHFEPVQLFKLIDKDDDVLEKQGWDKQLGQMAIINAAPEGMREQYGDTWSGYQASLRRGDVYWSNKAARIYYTDYLIKEFSGKITHCIVLDNLPNAGQGREAEEDRFLFQKTGRYKSFHEIIVPFHFDVGPDGNWYSVKGLGPKIYDFCDASNRFRCTMLNGAMAGCGIIMQAATADALQKVQQTPTVRASGATYVPPNWNFMKGDVAPRLDGPMQVLRELQLTMQSNTGQYRQRVSEEYQEPTLGQAQLNVQQQMTLTRGAYDRYYHYSDDMHEEILRRMLDPNISKDDPGGAEAIEFKEYCLKEGVPEEALDMKYVCGVHASRNIGYGSRQMQQVTGQQLIQLLPTMSERGRRNALRMNAAPLVGQSHVDALYEPYEETGKPDSQTQYATLENNMLRLPNAQLQVAPEDNPAIHFITHYKDAVGHVQQVQQGQGEPVGLVTHLDNVGPHNQQHLQAMEGDPTRKGAYEQMVKMQMGLAKIADSVKQQVAQAQAQEQQAQPQIDPAAMKDILKMIAELKLKETKQMADDARKDRKLEADMHRKDATTAANIMRRNAETMPNGMAA